jgi:N4-gp56 family major capsid protein
MSTISATNVEIQKPINVLLEDTLLSNAKARCPYFTGTEPGSITKHGGSATIKWRRLDTAADRDSGGIDANTTPLAELTGDAAYLQGRSAVAAAFTDQTATLAKFGQYYIINEEVDFFNFNHTSNGLMRTLGIAAGRSLNQLQRNVVEDNATAVFAGGVASDGAVVTSTAAGDLDKVILQLNVNSAMTFTPMTTGSQNIATTPILPAYIGICHPHVAADVSKISGFTSVEKYAGQVETYMGEFGTWGLAGQSVRFLQTEDASINAGLGGTTGSTGLRGATNIDIYTISIYGMEALGSVGLQEQHTVNPFMAGDSQPVIEFITKGFGEVGGDPYNEIATMAYKFWHAGAVLNSRWCRSLQVGSVSR